MVSKPMASFEQGTYEQMRMAAIVLNRESSRMSGGGRVYNLNLSYCSPGVTCAQSVPKCIPVFNPLCTESHPPVLAASTQPNLQCLVSGSL